MGFIAMNYAISHNMSKFPIVSAFEEIFFCIFEILLSYLSNYRVFLFLKTAFIESNALEVHRTPRDSRFGKTATFFQPMREEISFSISQ